MKRNPKVELYSIERSPLYGLTQHVKLASLLRISPKKVRELIVKRSALYNFRDQTINNKPRSIAVPLHEMRVAHERMKSLLTRIRFDNYLFSPRRGKTSGANAAAHAASTCMVKLDIKQFYPSTTAEHVFQFFKYRMQMADDIAGRLTKLCTINGKVPFGSPLSPILCALVHNDVFSCAAEKCNAKNILMTLWVDDLTISGESIPKSLVRDIMRLAKAKRLTPHKSTRSTRFRGAVITGAFTKDGRLAPSNKTHVKIRDSLARLGEHLEPNERAKEIERLASLTSYSLTLLDPMSPAGRRATSRLMWLRQQQRGEKRADLALAASTHASVAYDASPPWEG